MALDRFAADILNRCRIAQTGYGGHPNGAKLAVALVLRDWGYLNDVEWTELEVKLRIGGDIGGSLAEVDAWLDAIRDELEA